jgi:hypothetical protein
MKHSQSQYRGDAAQHQTSTDVLALQESRKSPSRFSFSAAC